MRLRTRHSDPARGRRGRSGGLRAAAAGATLGALTLAGCSGTSGTGGDASVIAAFYPLQFAAERVGGDYASVESLTPPGAEPHDVELTPQQVASIAEADLVVYIKGFQPAVDRAVAENAADRALDVAADLPVREAPDHSAEDGDEHGDEHADESAGDPHVWLDPTNMVAIADRISARLAAVEPDRVAEFRTAADTLAEELRELDAQWRDGTADCDSRDLVVSHEAFGYLADRYDFRQIGISGLSPESEPGPGTVARIADFVRDNDVRTIYYETLVDPKVAQSVADETGAQTAVLDPLEGPPEDASQDYLSVMRTNLDTVRAGQPCR